MLPTKASHRGGVWERIIRTIKAALTAILEEQPITDEVLHTTLVEVERILNDRPLVKQSEDPDDQYAITPSKLLLLRDNASTPVPEDITDTYFNRRWRQAQYLVDLFWKKWTKNYLPTLQTIARWHKVERDLRVGELVLLSDANAPRGKWSKAVVIDVVHSSDGLVREAVLKTNKGEIRRDIRSLCRLEGEYNRSEDDDVVN